MASKAFVKTKSKNNLPVALTTLKNGGTTEIPEVHGRRRLRRRLRLHGCSQPGSVHETANSLRH